MMGGSAEPPADPTAGAAGARRDAFEFAAGALARRELATAELARWLEARGVARDEVEEVVGRLIEIG